MGSKVTAAKNTPRLGTPTRIRGVDYPSISEAARQLKLNPSTIYAALEKGSLEQVGMLRRNKRPCTINGVDYPSLSAAGRVLGITPQSLGVWLDRRAKGIKPRAPLPCLVDGVEYPSVRIAAETLGVGVEKLRKRLARLKARGIAITPPTTDTN